MAQAANIVGLSVGIVLLLTGLGLFLVAYLSGAPVWGLYLGWLPFALGACLAPICTSNLRRSRKVA